MLICEIGWDQLFVVAKRKQGREKENDGGNFNVALHSFPWRVALLFLLFLEQASLNCRR